MKDRKEYSKEYREKNKEKIKEQNKKYREANKEKIEKWREDNKEKLLSDGKKYYEQNKEQCTQRAKEYYTNNKETRLQQIKQHKINNKEQYSHTRRIYEKNKYHTDSVYRTMTLIRRRTRLAISKFSLKNNTSIRKMLGCDKDTLMNHLQSTGILYDSDFDIYNYDSSLYHIDHKKTFEDVSKGIYTLEEVCHYTNLQILPAEINITKSGTSW